MLRKGRKAGVIDWVAEVDRPTVPRKRGKIALSDAQVSALEGLPLKGEQALVRDLFLLGTYTSLRRSDWDIRTTDIGTTKVNRKTGGAALIADSPKLRRLLRKHRGHLSYSTFRPDAKGSTRTVSFDKMQAKVMAQLAEVCPVLNEVMPHRGGMVPKYRAIGSHSGRKSFISKHATGARALPTATIMRATGHRSLAQLQAYIQDTVDDTETAKLFR
jgi:integrase